MDPHHVSNAELLGTSDQHHQLLDSQPEHVHHIADPDGMAGNHGGHQQVPMENWVPTGVDSFDGLKRVVLDLQRHWLNDFQRQREKLLIEVTEKLHEEFLADEEKTRGELCQQFKEELDTTKDELEKKYRESLRSELMSLEERHKKDLANTKKQQWCWQCDKEAIYPCCWNTAYCCVECQQAHWPMHKKFCRRKKAGGGAPGAQPVAPK